jgi:hypothetical protein
MVFTDTPCQTQVMEYKKIQLKGGTLQGASNPTWMKQDGDAAVMAFGCGLMGYGMFQLVRGFYQLATGTGKMD